MENENHQFGLGVIRNPQDYKDYKLPALAAANLPEVDDLDWDNGFFLDKPPQENQNGSGSCTEQAFCYDFYNKHKIDLSRRDGYSRIGRPDQSGAMPHEPYWIYDTAGQHTRQNSPDPAKQTEVAMKEPVNINAPRNADFKVRYWSPPDLAIDTIARLIKQYKGATGCFNITWEGWADKKNPRAPRREDTQYAGSHMLWLYGFKKVNGEKKIYADSSWAAVTEHRIGEDYLFLNTPHAFGFYAAEYRKVLDTMQYVVIEYNGKLGVGIFDGGFVECIAWAKDKQQILDLCKAYGITPVGYDASGYPLPTHSIKKIR